MNDIHYIVEIAKQWEEFSYLSNGWETISYDTKNFSVWCYFAEGGNHKSVKFTDKRSMFSSKEFSVKFFNPIVVEYRLSCDLAFIVETASAFLDEIKDEHDKKTDKERLDERQRKIEVLKKQLEVLEENNEQN